MNNFNNVYKDKVVLVTGHTGFKGSWLCIWLLELGAKVIGYALEPKSQNDIFVLTQLQNKMIDITGDIRDRDKLKSVFEKYKPEYVFHLAAQPLVHESYRTPVDTYMINVMGTVNVLECIREVPSVKVCIFITTDKCYSNKEQIWGYKEDDALGGYDPYSSSKAAAEIAIHSWRHSFMNVKDDSTHNIAIATARAGNVIGGGDWSENRIIPDCIKALENNQKIKIRNPQSVRPWQHVLEPLSGYLLLGEKMTYDPQKYSTSWNFGPLLQSLVSVEKLVDDLIVLYGKGEVEKVNHWIQETNFLNLDISKSYFLLGWKPNWDIKQTLFYTVEWYKSYMSEDPYTLCLKQIEEYEKQKGNDNE